MSRHRSGLHLPTAGLSTRLGGGPGGGGTLDLARPYADNSPFNIPTPGGPGDPLGTAPAWVDYDRLHIAYAGNYWYISEGGCQIWRGRNTDPIWTFNFLDFFGNGNVAQTQDPWNRYRLARQEKMRCPAGMTPNVDSDHHLQVVTVTGDEFQPIGTVLEQYFLQAPQFDPVARTITGTTGNPQWAKSNAISGKGCTSTCHPDTWGAGDPGGDGHTGLGSNDGTRAANCSPLLGHLDADQWTAGAFRQALVVALNPAQLKRANVSTPHGADAMIYPATCGEVGGANNGRIKIGAKIGLGSDAYYTSIGQAAAWSAAKTLLANPLRADRFGSTANVAKIAAMTVDVLQRYGAFVMDATGGSTQFYIDRLNVPPGGMGGEDGVGAFSPMFTHWNQWYGPDDGAHGSIMNVLNPFLRVCAVRGVDNPLAP